MPIRGLVKTNFHNTHSFLHNIFLTPFGTIFSLLFPFPLHFVFLPYQQTRQGPRAQGAASTQPRSALCMGTSCWPGARHRRRCGCWHLLASLKLSCHP
jgi:hypothetical protein